MKKKHAVIVANGERPSKKIWNKFITDESLKICADGGLRHFDFYNGCPDIIIGDLDSAGEDLLSQYSGKAEIVRVSRQSDTDLEKAIKYAIKKKIESITILAATGGRLDHTLANIGLLVKYHSRVIIRLINNSSVLQVYSRSFKISSYNGQTISLYGLGNETMVSTEGLQYELNNRQLSLGGYESTSNTALENIVTIVIHSGCIALVQEV